MSYEKKFWTLFNPHSLAIVERRKQQKTKTWSKKYNQRAGVEGTISQGIRGLGLRECRYVGLDNVHLQHILTATAMNAVRLFAWVDCYSTPVNCY